jgi:hypothetical protein
VLTFYLIQVSCPLNVNRLEGINRKLWSVLVGLVVISHHTSTCMYIIDRTMFVQMDIYLRNGASELDNIKTTTDFGEIGLQ